MMSNELEIAFKSGFQKEAQENLSEEERKQVLKEEIKKRRADYGFGDLAASTAMGGLVGTAGAGAISTSSPRINTPKSMLYSGIGSAALSGLTSLPKALYSGDNDE